MDNTQTEKMTLTDRVAEIFGGGQLYCAETSLKLLADAGDIDATPYIPLATGFCSGASRTCGQCGVVSGIIMGLGLYAGRSTPGGDYEPAYVLVQEFVERFEKRCGSLNCEALIGCDFSSPEGQERFREKRLIRKCIQYVVFGVGTALDILQEHGCEVDPLQVGHGVERS